MSKQLAKKVGKILLLLTITLLLGLILFLPQKTFAAAGDIHNSLIAGGGGRYETSVLTGWRICLGLANVFVASILVFIAVVNIAHIQYDTYNLRKTLPWLIIGIILANFSLLIVRMFVDVADILTYTFATSDPATTIIEPLYTNLGIAQLAAGFTIGAGTAVGIIALVTGGVGILTLIPMMIILLLILLLPFIGFAALAFLLYIRVAVILILAIVAPIAFVMLAFPITQQFFKQWWNWFVKWVFMKPISFFLLWAAAQLGDPRGGSVTIVSFMITLALCYLSLVAPFKLGGAVMAGWGKIGKYLPNKGIAAGQAYGKRKYDKTAAQAKAVFGRTSLGRAIMRNLAQDELDKRTAEEELKSQLARGEREIRHRRGGRQESKEIDIEMEKQRLEQAKQDRTFEIYTGERGREIANFEADIANSQLRLEKIKDDHRFMIAGDRLRADAIMDEDPGLKQAHKNVDSAQTKLTMARNDTERLAAQTELRAAESALATEQTRYAGTLVGTVNPLTGQNFANLAQAQAYVRDAHLQKYQRTRFYKIYNTRVAEDAQTDALSYAPSDIPNDLLPKIQAWLTSGGVAGSADDVEVSYGPSSTRISEVVKYLRHRPGDKVENAAAANYTTAKLQQLRLQMKDIRLMGDALQAHAQIVDAVNPEYLTAAIHQMYGRISKEAMDGMEDTLGRPMTEADLRDIVLNRGLNTNNRHEREIAGGIVSQLEKGDLKQITDAGGVARDGASGLGTSAFGYVQKT